MKMNFSFFYIRFDKYVFVQVIKVNTFAFSDVENAYAHVSELF